MTSWYRLDLGDGAQAFQPSGRILDAWLAASVKSGGLPYDHAVFSRNDLRENMVTAYFSPAAADLAAMLDATPCDPPLRDERLGLLAGDVRAWNLLFTDQSLNKR